MRRTNTRRSVSPDRLSSFPTQLSHRQGKDGDKEILILPIIVFYVRPLLLEYLAQCRLEQPVDWCQRIGTHMICDTISMSTTHVPAYNLLFSNKYTALYLGNTPSCFFPFNDA